MWWFASASVFCFFFFFNDTATTEIYTLSLHDALPISRWDRIALEVRATGCIHDMDEGVRLAQVIKELVAQAAALVGLRNEPRDIEQFHGDEPRASPARSVVRLAGNPELGVRTRLAHVGHTAVRFDRGERIIRNLNRNERRRSEESRLPHIRFPDDPQLHAVSTGLGLEVP